MFVHLEEIKKRLRAHPFVPFRIQTSDGKHLDVKHPEMAWLTRMALLVAPPVADPTEDIPERHDSVSPLHIVRIEPVVPA